VGLAVAAILLAVGVPSFRTAILSNRLTSTTNDLVGTLAQARSEAIRRGTRVTVCISSDGLECATTGSWEQGWISFVDNTRPTGVATAKVVDGTPPGQILAVTQRGASSTLIRGSTGVEQYVSFAADGTTRTMLGTTPVGTLPNDPPKLLVCEPSSALTNANRAREIEVSATGRLSTKTPPDVSGSCPTPL